MASTSNAMSAERTEVIGGLLKRIGNFDPQQFSGDFDGRLIFQKSIYLMQAFGLYIGIPFSWYLHGPYSTVLAKHGYELARKYEKVPIIRFAKESSEERFQLFIDFLGTRKDDAVWLEALASIHFLRSTYPNLRRKEIISMVLRKQSHLTSEECGEAWNYLVKYKLINERD